MNSTKEEKIILINNNDILPNRYQPRKKFSEDELLDLTESIKKYGILEPIIVRPLGDKYELVAGERRYKANVLAGNDNIPTRIINLDDAECSEIAIIENLQRKDLSALEEALSYKRAIDLGYTNQKQLAEKIGKSQSYVANKIRLLKLSDEVQDALIENKISERHARSLLKINNIEKQNEMLKRIITERLTVRRTDEEIEKMNNDNTNLTNSGELQTTPLSTIFNEKNDQQINENGVFTFGPESVENTEKKPLMSFDLNGNPLNNDKGGENDSSSGIKFNMFSAPEAAPIQPQMTVEPQVNEQPQPFNMFSAPEAAPTQPQMTVEPQVNEQPQPFNMFSAPEAAPMQPQMTVEPQVNEQPQPFNMFSAPEAAPIQPQMTVEPQVNEQPQPFNMFSAPEAAPMQPQMTVEPQVNEQPQPFNMFSAPEAAPMQPQMTVESQVNEQPQPFNMFSAPEAAPTQPQMTVEPQVNEQPQPFNMFSAPEAAPIQPQMTVEPQVNEQPQPFNMFSAPETSPMQPQMTVEPQVNEQVQGFNLNDPQISQTPIFNSNQTDTIAEFKKPEPIIVTDYSKQYDPVMPDTEPKAPDIDFKTIINLIRQCSDTIEKCGFKIDTEEYDLENMYQVVFKIDKH